MHIGLFLSRDNGAISDVVDVDALARKFSLLAVVKTYNDFFTRSSIADIVATVRDRSLDGVILAGNSPLHYEQVPAGGAILEAIRGMGINPSKIAFANLREQVALPHRGDREGATRKARQLIDVALAEIDRTPDLPFVSVAPRKSVLIVGTDLGGIIAAQHLLEKGYRVSFVERSATITSPLAAAAEALPLLSAVQLSERACFYFNTDVADISGWCGDYSVRLERGSGEERLSVGGILVNVGKELDWIKHLQLWLRLDFSRDGNPKSRLENSCCASHDPGIWFVPACMANDLMAWHWEKACTAVLGLSSFLDKPEILHPVTVTAVDKTLCGGCGACVKTCIFGASKIDPLARLSVIDERRCKGCGNCVVACPTGARDLRTRPERFVFEAISRLSDMKALPGEPKILALLCRQCGYRAADRAGLMAAQDERFCYSSRVVSIMMECGGSVDTQYVFEAFRRGFDGVAITVCRDGHCHNSVGNTDLARRLGLFREVLRSRNISDDRLRIVQVSESDGESFSAAIQSFSRDLVNLRSH